MPRTSDLAKLLRAATEGRIADVRRLGLDLAAAQRKSGYSEAAKRLEHALTFESVAGSERAVPVGLDPSFFDVLGQPPPSLTLLGRGPSLDEIVLPGGARTAVDGLLREHTARERLLAHGLRPRNRVFLHGPPGCGKTSLTRALGEALGLPVYLVRFDALLGPFLGQTAERVAQVFRFAEHADCIVVFDELDAIGRRRGSHTDVGEVDRIVISLMQLLELAAPRGLIIGASNLPDALDPALRRRFDLEIVLPKPDINALQHYADTEAARRGLDLTAAVRLSVTRASSFADARMGLDAFHRAQLIDGP